MKAEFGQWLIKLGANLIFKSNENRDLLKNNINHETWLYAMAGSGGHILGEIKPMNEFDTDSVISVLKSGDILNTKITTRSKKDTYYLEKWVC